MKFIIKTLLVVLVFIGYTATSDIAFAQERQQVPCGPRDQIVEKLKNTYKEIPAAIGLANNGQLFEIFASKKGTWSLILTQPNKTSCMMLAGSDFDIVKSLNDLNIHVEYIK